MKGECIDKAIIEHHKGCAEVIISAVDMFLKGELEFNKEYVFSSVSKKSIFKLVVENKKGLKDLCDLALDNMAIIRKRLE